MLELFKRHCVRLIDTTPRQLFHIVGRRIHDSKASPEDFPSLCVFALSTGRTGTQTLAHLFNLVSGVYASHEPEPHLYGLSKIAYEQLPNDGSKGMRSLLCEAFLTARRKRFADTALTGRRYVETSPQVTFLAPLIVEALPRVKFVHIVRDPRSVVRSAMRRRWYQGNKFDCWRIVPGNDSKDAESWQQESPFERNIWLWSETNRWIGDFLSQLPADQKLTVKSEQLFANDRETLSSLFALIDSDSPDPRKIRRILAKHYNQETSGKFSDIGSWTPEMRATLGKIAGPIASRYGYDL